MKKRILLMITLTTFFLLTGCKKVDRTITEQVKTNDKYSENVNIKSTVLDDTIILFIINNNNITIDSNITINFYNKKNKLISSDEDSYSAITPKKEIIVSFNIYKDYDHYEIKLDSQKTKYTNYENDISIVEKNNKNDKTITFNIKNNSKDTIEYLELAILFYKKDKLVYYDSEYVFKLKKDKVANVEFLYPYTDDLNDLEFDTYKVYTNEVCSYNSEAKDED